MYVIKKAKIVLHVSSPALSTKTFDQLLEAKIMFDHLYSNFTKMCYVGKGKINPLWRMLFVVFWQHPLHETQFQRGEIIKHASDYSQTYVMAEHNLFLKDIFARLKRLKLFYAI